MGVATFCSYKNVRRTMCTAMLSYFIKQAQKAIFSRRHTETSHQLLIFNNIPVQVISQKHFGISSDKLTCTDSKLVGSLLFCGT